MCTIHHMMYIVIISNMADIHTGLSQANMLSVTTEVLYMYKFLRDVILEVFVVNWLSMKFSSLKFH